jgi:2-polyprenyl-6-methoxyphenol hydroxylase-like FAD-dependent oxidoreductase
MSPVDRLKLMKSFAAEWVEPMKSAVLGIPEGTEVKAIRLEDWVLDREDWDNKGGRLTLIGDAAHAMTMCMSLYFCILTLLLTSIFPT